MPEQAKGSLFLRAQWMSDSHQTATVLAEKGPRLSSVMAQAFLGSCSSSLAQLHPSKAQPLPSAVASAHGERAG